MMILVPWLIIIAIVLMFWVSYVYSYSKLVKNENIKLKDKLDHVETELANLKSKTEWDNY